jgi:hypothetical protein
MEDKNNRDKKLPLEGDGIEGVSLQNPGTKNDPVSEQDERALAQQSDPVIVDYQEPDAKSDSLCPSVLSSTYGAIMQLVNSAQGAISMPAAPAFVTDLMEASDRERDKMIVKGATIIAAISAAAVANRENPI